MPDEENEPEIQNDIDDESSVNDETSAIDDIAAELGAHAGTTDAETELAEAQGRALRAQAELENFRKRSRREIEDNRRYAAIPLIRDLLPTLDNLDRALEAAENDESASGLKEGVEMVATQMRSVLSQHNCQLIEPEGQPFDPMFHEAISELPNPEIPRGHVALVHQVGYQIHDRVIRPAQVIVSSGPAE